jgi:hypothetical protein
MVLEEQVTGNSETELPPRSQDTESGINGAQMKGKGEDEDVQGINHLKATMITPHLTSPSPSH